MAKHFMNFKNPLVLLKGGIFCLLQGALIAILFRKDLLAFVSLYLNLFSHKKCFWGFQRYLLSKILLWIFSGWTRGRGGDQQQTLIYLWTPHNTYLGNTHKYVCAPTHIQISWENRFNSGRGRRKELFFYCLWRSSGDF